MDESDEQRRMLTQVSVAKRVIRLIVIVVAIGVALLELSLFESVGIALLASAGAGGVILGLAGQTVLGNLLAGLQIAITRPFRISDSVFIEDNWGRIENVTYTYVIIRTWDHRRLIFPVRYFLEHYIENWSKTNRFLVKPIYLHVDYRLDVQTLREKFFELLRDDEDWTETEDSYLAVTDTTEETMVVRLTCGAADPSTAWYLAIRIREHIIAWLQEYHDGRYLPRQRVQLVEQADHNEMNGSAAPEHDQDER
jgi:small-conductance mechanosensitive channel